MFSRTGRTVPAGSLKKQESMTEQPANARPANDTPHDGGGKTGPGSILITGASGFIGSFLVERALQEGMTVWAAVRATSSRRWLSDPRIRFVELDLSDEERLGRQMAAHVERHGAWDFIIHAAGATKCRRKEDFFRTNTDGTLRLARLARLHAAVTGRFVFVSSLSVMGNVCDDRPDAAIDDTMAPQPNTAYGRSKLAAERGLAELARKGEAPDYIVLRPTGVYGPRERDYFLMAKSLKRHVDFSVGYRRQDLTFIYVRDLVEAAFLALRNGTPGRSYFLTDGADYPSRAFSDLLQARMGIRHVLRVKAPLWVLRAVCAVAGTAARMTGSVSTLNADKYNIMKQRNWKCDISPARRELGYEPAWTLKAGVDESIDWYKKEKWL